MRADQVWGGATPSCFKIGYSASARTRLASRVVLARAADMSRADLLIG